MNIAAMPLVIGYFQMKKQGQAIREEGPNWVGAWQNQLTPTLFILLFVLALYGVIGFLDDFIKIFKKRNMGLNSKQKLLGQIIGGIIFYLVYRSEGYPGTLNFFGIELPLGLFYGVFAIFWLVGFSNAVNLTDGIDGLVAGLGTISFATYGIIAWHQQQYDVLVICLSVLGGLLGFFAYNRKPAKIFMGDVGSLALGGLLAAISIMLNQEWTLLLVGLTDVMETASVMLHVTTFKLPGKRIFKMSPIHHHFEMCGWSEWKIDIIFWLVSIVTSLITLWFIW